MHMQIVFQGKNDPPQKADAIPPVYNLSGNETMTVVLVEGGMTSGEPSVLILSESAGIGTVVLQTSLDKYLMAAQAMMAGAKSRWGWEQPEGYASLMPMEPEQRKKLLESIKKELEEWDA